MPKLLEPDRLVFNQKGKLIELTNEYLIRDESGNDVGLIRQEGQTALKKIARFVSSLDQFMTHTLAVYDADEGKVLELTRPRKVFKSRLEVSDGTGRSVGEIMQKNVFGKIRFDLVGSSGQTLGQIRAENWRAWNFAIVDASEREVARITKKWAGLAAPVPSGRGPATFLIRFFLEPRGKYRDEPAGQNHLHLSGRHPVLDPVGLLLRLVLDHEFTSVIAQRLVQVQKTQDVVRIDAIVVIRTRELEGEDSEVDEVLPVDARKTLGDDGPQAEVPGNDCRVLAARTLTVVSAADDHVSRVVL